MNFDFSDDQRLFQQEVRRMLADTSTSAAVRTVLDGKEACCAQVWRNLVGMGAAGAAIPVALVGAVAYLALGAYPDFAARQAGTA